MARAAPARGVTELFLISYFALLYAQIWIITWHDPFLRIIIWTTRLLYYLCSDLCTWQHFDSPSIWLWEPEKTQRGCLPCLKDAMNVSFKELLLNMDNVLKSNIIYNKKSPVLIHWTFHSYTLLPNRGYRKAKLPKAIGPKRMGWNSRSSWTVDTDWYKVKKWSYR